MIMRFMRRLFTVAIAVTALALVFYLSWLSPRYTVPILMYHQFGYEESSLFVTPENFERQLVYLKNKGYQVISLQELVEGMKDNRQFPQGTVVITIDDGYRNNAVYAYPLLRKYRFPAMIFIIADYLGEEKDFISIEEAEDMLKNGISFGAHTRHHVYLPEIKDPQAAWDEIAGAKTILEQKLKTPVEFFCYPAGGFTTSIKEMVKKAGYKGACTTNRGFQASNSDPYELKRIKVTNADTRTPFVFWAKLSGHYNLFRTAKRGY